MIIPISAFEPPWYVIKRGKRKKQPRLDTVKKLATDIRTKDGVYTAGSVFGFHFDPLIEVCAVG